jgi:ribosomal protein S11
MNKDTIMVIKDKTAFRMAVVDGSGEVIFKGNKPFSSKANATQAAKAFAKRHDKFSFLLDITKENSSTSWTKPTVSAHEFGSRDY